MKNWEREVSAPGSWGPGRGCGRGEYLDRPSGQDLEALKKLKGRNSLSNGTGLGKLQQV